MVIHILKSGETLTDISGHEVTREDVPTFYDIADRIREEVNEKT